MKTKTKPTRVERFKRWHRLVKWESGKGPAVWLCGRDVFCRGFQVAPPEDDVREYRLWVTRKGKDSMVTFPGSAKAWDVFQDLCDDRKLAREWKIPARAETNWCVDEKDVQEMEAAHRCMAGA